MNLRGILLLLTHLLVQQSFSNSPNISLLAAVTTEEVCDNGIDDDGDGLIDCFDPDCCENASCSDTYFDPCAIQCLPSLSPQPISVTRKWVSQNNNWHPYNTPITGDIDGDGAIEIIGNRGNWQGQVDYKNLLILDGLTGQQKAVINTPWFTHIGGEICIGDVDGNGRAEIFFQISSATSNDESIRLKMTCYEYDGENYQVKWISQDTTNPGIPGLADFNEDGIPELYIGNHIFNSLTGETLLFGAEQNSNGNGLAVAADVLPDDECSLCEGMELIVGNEVYAVKINTDSPSNGVLSLENRVFSSDIGDGYTSIADVDQDGDLDAIVNSPNSETTATLFIWDIQRPQLIGRFAFETSNGGWSSLPCIKDINGDAYPEIAISSNGVLRMLSFDGGNLNELWQISTLDFSSRAGATIFDLNNDGSYELIHRDQEQFRILNALTGNIFYAEACASTNLYEYPIVVDIDQDGAAEILCSCESELRAYTSSSTPWSSSRSIWNQYHYFYTNINDDLTIPVKQQPPNLPGIQGGLNSFLNQYSNEYPKSILEVSLPEMFSIQQGQSISFEPMINASNAIQLAWMPDESLSCNSCPSPEATPMQDQQYDLIVTDQVGCKDTVSTFVKVLICGKESIEFPNAFTPDGDGLNDDFSLFLDEELNLTGSIAIYNRWGKVVFQSNALENPWNGLYKGKPAPSDAYIIMINFQCPDGIRQTIRETLYLIR